MIFDSSNETVTLDRAEAQATWSAMSHCLEVNLYDDPDAIFEKKIVKQMLEEFKENFMPAPSHIKTAVTNALSDLEVNPQEHAWGNDVQRNPVAAMQYCAATSKEAKIALYDELYQVILDLSPSEYFALQHLIGKDILDTIQPVDVR